MDAFLLGPDESMTATLTRRVELTLSRPCQESMGGALRSHCLRYALHATPANPTPTRAKKSAK